MSLNFLSPSLRDCASSQDRPNFFISCLTPSHPVFLGRPLGLVPYTSITLQHLIQSVSSLLFTCPNRVSLPSVITKLTGSSPISSLSSQFFLSCRLNPHVRLILLISFLSNFTSYSIFIGQVLLPYIKQLLYLSS